MDNLLFIDFSCGLKLSTATAISAAVATAAKQGILIKGGNYIEALADIDTVVMDKTGTITVGEPKIVETHTAEGVCEKEMILLAASAEIHSVHPLAVAIQNYVEEQGWKVPDHIDSDTVVAHGMEANVDDFDGFKGGHIIVGSHHFMMDREVTGLDNFSDIETMPGHNILYVARDAKLMGLIVINDPIRPQMKKTFNQMRRRKVSIFSGLTHTPDIKRITNNAKVTDHHAIIPTVQLEKQNISELPESEQKVIRLVSMRLLCATGEKHIYDETSVTLSCEGYAFKAKGKTVVQDGWKAIEQRFKNSLKDKEAADDEKAIPSFKENDIIHSVSASVTEHFTSPPKAFTEDTLLSAMETAGNEDFEDDTEKKGLGTPATRAGIIEKLVRSGFAERKGKSLVPTKDGINLVAVLPEQITSPTMTAEWENTLMQIERGKADADKFLAGIVDMTTSLIKAYPFLSDAEANRFESGKEVIGKCPRCGSPVYVGKGNYYCSSKSCSFCLWEDNKFFSSKKKKLTKKIAKELLDKGWCRVTGLYTPKKPQLYDAVIRLDDTGGKYVSFKMEFDR